MTSRAVYERVGGFQEHEDRVFWLEDEAYIQDIEARDSRLRCWPASAYITRAALTTPLRSRKDRVLAASERSTHTADKIKRILSRCRCWGA